MAEFENYDNTAGSYALSRRTPGLSHLLGAIASSCAQTLDKAEVLEIGCGTGNYLHALKTTVKSIVGLDANESMLRIAGERMTPDDHEHQRVHLHHGCATELPFTSGSFDAVYTCQVLHHMAPDGHMTRQVIAEIKRVLRPGGVMYHNVCTAANTRCALHCH
eukprot:SAG31_NODE_3372_length_4351_cov_4.835842_1_plen_162_part_00